MVDSGKEWAIRRVLCKDWEIAWQIVAEYYEAAQVVARDGQVEFRESYFHDRAGFWLATVDWRPVGCIALRRQGTQPGSGELKRLYVQLAFRGRGVAADLYAELEEAAREMGYRWLYLDTAAEMLAAQRFYLGLGYEHCDRYNDNSQASVFMRKRLA